MKQYLFIALFTAGVTFALTWAVLRFCLAKGIYPPIRERDIHTNPTPRIGGLGIYLGIMAAFAISVLNPFFNIIWLPPNTMWSLIAAATLIAVVGLLDDLRDLDWFIKLAAQFGAAAIVTIFGGLQILSLPIGGVVVGSSTISIAITMFAIVIVMNAVNFIDGLDGLVVGVCLIANGVFFAYSYILIRDFNASTYFNLASFIAAVLIGACVGFLPWNWNPAKIFMGDTGALTLGLLMATSGIAITGQLQPSMVNDPDAFGRSQLLGAFIPILLPIAIVLLPLADFGLAVVRRSLAGRSPFSPDRKHLHHRMLDMGHSDKAAVLIFYAWTAVISLSLLLMYVGAREDWPGQYWPGAIFGVVGAAACVLVTLLPDPKTMHRKQQDNQKAATS